MFTLFSSIVKSLKLFDISITTPLIPPSFIKRLEPLPITRYGTSSSFKSFITLAICSSVLGFTNISAGPPTLNEICFFQLFGQFLPGKHSCYKLQESQF